MGNVTLKYCQNDEKRFCGQQHQVLPMCWEQDRTQPVPHCCSLILNSNVLPLQVTNGFLLTDGSNLPPPHLSLCRSLMWLAWGCQASAEGALLEVNLPFLELIYPGTPVQGSVTPDKLHRVTSLKPLLWIVNFDPPLVLNIGRWLMKNIMVMR